MQVIYVHEQSNIPPQVKASQLSDAFYGLNWKLHALRISLCEEQ